MGLAKTKDCGFGLGDAVTRFVCALCLLGVCTNVAAEPNNVAAEPNKASEEANTQRLVSYALGARQGEALKQQFPEDLNFEWVIKGLKDSVESKELLYDERKMTQALAEFQQRHFAKQQAKQRELADANLKTGEAFLQQNAKKSGVQTLDSGLQYKIIVEGKGNEKPAVSDKVKVHYHGTLVDGTVFDSSVERGEPVSFPVSGVIKGWTEALQLMSVGDKWQLYIPSRLAYGERGTSGGPIGPNAALIFEVELLAIES